MLQGPGTVHLEQWKNVSSPRATEDQPFELGMLYKEGSDEFPCDPTVAAAHFRFAAEQGHPEATSQLKDLEAHYSL